MRKIKKIFITGIILSLFSGISFAGDSINVSVDSFNINGQNRKANVVKIDLNDENLVFEVVKGNDKVVSSESFKDMIERKEPVVAINGNYFDAYKSLVPYGSIIKNGRIIYLEGENASFSVMEGNAVHMDEYQIILKGYLDGNRKNYYDSNAKKMVFNLFNIWYVNTKPMDTTGAYLYTPEYGDEIELEGGYAVIIKEDIVSGIVKNPKKVSIPSNGYLIYYADDCVEESYVVDRFQRGRKVEIECEVVDDYDEISTVINSKKYIEENEDKENNSNSLKSNDKKEIDNKFYLKDAQQLISAGPLIISDGRNVVNESKEKFKEDKIKKNAAQRSAIGITKDNKVVMVTISRTTVSDLALIMEQLNCEFAMNLDGGASSALYANGKMITTPGRKLNTVLMVLDK